jgi:hypothetical protein
VQKTGRGRTRRDNAMGPDESAGIIIPLVNGPVGPVHRH